jgi:hypothetical protein
VSFSWRWRLRLQSCGVWCQHCKYNFSKTSLIRTNWERTLVLISESPNYRSDTIICSGKL